MHRILVAGRTIELPALPLLPRSPSSDDSAWELGAYVTVRLTAPVEALRLHTDGKAFPGRPASQSSGAWVAIGDVIQTSSQIASTRALPTDDPSSATAFTHVNHAMLPVDCVLNIGIAGPKFGGYGGGFQAEYVSGPRIQFVPLKGKHWHGKAARA